MPKALPRATGMKGAALAITTSMDRFEAIEYASPVPGIVAAVRSVTVGGSIRVVATFRSEWLARWTAVHLNAALLRMREAEAAIVADRESLS